MIKNFNTRLFFFFIVFNINQNIYSIYKLEGVLFNKTPSSLFKKKDSLFKVTYNRILNKYNNKNYVDALNEALAFSGKIKNKDSLTLVNILIADIYDKTNYNNKALSYYKKALRLFSLKENLENNIKLKSNDLYAKTLLKIGGAYQKKSMIDSAKYYYNKLEILPSNDNETLGFKAISFSNLSGIYQRDSLFEKAKEYSKKAIDIHIRRNDKVNQASAINNLASIYLSLKDFGKAKELYLNGVELIKNDNSARAVRFKASLYYNLAWAMRNLKDYKAYDFQELSYELEDVFRDKEIKTMIETVTAKHNVETVKKEEENKRLKDQKTFLFVGIGAFVIIISLLYWLNFYKLKQKNLGLKLIQTELLQSQKIEKIKSDSQTRILNATIDGKETERKQIAETLHDSVSALLSSANLHLQAARGHFKGEIPVEIQKTSTIITEASQKIRNLSHTLVSSVLLKFGLKFAIVEMAQKYSNSQLKIEANIRGIRRYEQNFEIKMHNIIQEFVNNILKHSKATEANVNLEEKEETLYLHITDNGIGFDKTQITEKDGLGINQIDARIRVMQGFFHIDSNADTGTSIKVELPIVKKRNT